VSTTAPLTAPRRAPRKAPTSPRRVLRLVRQGERTPESRRRRARLAAVFTVLVAGLGLFAVVAFHVVLTQNQFRLDQLRTSATTEQARYQRLRLQVAQLESPDRIVATAQKQLGMVQPPSIVYLAPVQPAPGLDDPAANAARSQGGWSTVKPQLAASP
jgi:cell division protein FtsL